MSLALYRKYRSATFAELIGQDHIAQTLRNQVRAGTVAHAYLFAGIRGTGKTSTARILARAITCLQPRDGEPCNSCTACEEVLGGRALDVLEIDAASNRGIDEMRDLRERVKFLPAALRRKVYIVDEAHMLTPEAWNAFLKTLEEPPDHVVFVLATTEPHKIPETVRSRVQRFDFRRVGLTELQRHLERVCEQEGVEAVPEALALVAAAGQGSVRDALSVLDQALATAERPLSIAAVRRALGLADPGVLRAVLLAVAGGDAGGALRAIAEAFAHGGDARQLLREMARLARGAEMVAIGYPEGAELAGDDLQLCTELAAAGRAGIWVEAIDRFAEAEVNLRQPVDARLQVELALLRLSRRGSGVGPAAVAPAPPARASALAPAPAPPSATVVAGGEWPEAAPILAGPNVEAAVAAEAGRPEASPPAGAIPPGLQAAPPGLPGGAADGAAETSPPPGGAPTDLEGWVAAFPRVIETLSRRDPMLAGVLRSCRPVEGGPGRLVIGAPYGFHLERLRDTQKAPLLAEAVTAVAGGAATVECVFSGEVEAGAGRGSRDPDQPDATSAVLAAFPGSRLVGSRLRDPRPE
ncbi:MAG TPA: DNA polymerase III subunit gamma/tau [Candidatus Dormibacteraeota bacterium]